MKVKAKIPVMHPGEQRWLRPEDGVVEVDDVRYWRRRAQVGDIEMVEELPEPVLLASPDDLDPAKWVSSEELPTLPGRKKGKE